MYYRWITANKLKLVGQIGFVGAVFWNYCTTMQMNNEPQVTLVFNDKRLGATMVEKDLVIIDTSDAMMVGSLDYE